MSGILNVVAFNLLAAWLAVGTAGAQAGSDASSGEELVRLEFHDVELSVLIDAVARLTKTNFIYDDRLRGRVTILTPTAIPPEQAYALLESALQMKGFTTVATPGGAIKVIPSREARGSGLETVRDADPPPSRNRSER